MSTSTTAFPTILVPLDGSELAERALPVAEHLARATDSPLVLVQVIPVTTWAFSTPGGWVPAERYQELLDNEDRAARHYLSHTAERLQAAGLQARTLALRGEPASTLIDLEPGARVGLVVMATHGRTGLARFALGSVADRVAREGRAPVLLVRPFGDDRRNARLERALVPLDGSRTAEQALDTVTHLAGNVLKHVTLVRVIDPDRQSGETEDTQGYLDATRAHLIEQFAGRDCAIEATIFYGKVPDQIIEQAEREYDVVIMATHGRGGADRWAYGSVADRVLRGLHVPLLLVHATA